MTALQTLRRHGVIADRVTLEGESAKLWAVTTPDGGKFFMKELGYRRYRSWPSIEAMRRDALGDAVASSTSPTRVMELLAEYSSRQGSIVQFRNKEQAMPRDEGKDQIDALATAYIEGESDDRTLTFRLIGEILADRPDLMDHAVNAMTEMYAADGCRKQAA